MGYVILESKILPADDRGPFDEEADNVRVLERMIKSTIMQNILPKLGHIVLCPTGIIYKRKFDYFRTSRIEFFIGLGLEFWYFKLDWQVWR